MILFFSRNNETNSVLVLVNNDEATNPTGSGDLQVVYGIHIYIYT